MEAMSAAIRNSLSVGWGGTSAAKHSPRVFVPAPAALRHWDGSAIGTGVSAHLLQWWAVQ